MVAARALWRLAAARVPHLAAVFVAELDFREGESSITECDDFVIFRNFPGEGCRAMAWLVRHPFSRVARVSWHGRSAALRLRATFANSPSDTVVVGWHAAHKEAWWASVRDLSSALRRHREVAHLAVVGDTNLDMLGQLQLPLPHRLQGCRGQQDREGTLRRAALTRVAESVNLQLCLPNEVLDSLCGDWALETALCPITRVPQGELSQRQKPSLIDYAFTVDGDERLSVSWTDAPADHAMLYLSLPRPRPLHRAQQAAWRCAEADYP